jgi:D-alanine-D-alanine ligase
MKIGITFDLRDDYIAAGYSETETAEFDRPDTIAAIDSALQLLGHSTDRIGNIWQLTQRLAAGDRWDLVFNICEGLYGLGREAQVPALLDAYEIPYTFSDPAVMAASLHKGFAKAIVAEAGVPTARSVLITSLGQLDSHSLCFPLFAKPVAEGTGKGINSRSIISTPGQLEDVCRHLLAEFRQGVLVEEYLSGRELTVGILGTGGNASVLGTMEITLLPEAEQGVYSYTNKEYSEELCTYRLVRPEDDDDVRLAEQYALVAWNAMGCRDAGRLDFRCNAWGQPNFLEVNPLAGLHPTHSDLPMIGAFTGMPFTELVRGIVDSAMARVTREATAIPVPHLSFGRSMATVGAARP